VHLTRVLIGIKRYAICLLGGREEHKLHSSRLSPDATSVTSRVDAVRRRREDGVHMSSGRGREYTHNSQGRLAEVRSQKGYLPIRPWLGWYADDDKLWRSRRRRM